MISGRLRFESTHATEFVDITAMLSEAVQKSGLGTGRVHLQSLHTTLGLAVNENEPLLLRDAPDLRRVLVDAGQEERLLPTLAVVAHEHVAHRRRIGVANVWRRVDVVDRCREIEAHTSMIRTASYCEPSPSRGVESSEPYEGRGRPSPAKCGRWVASNG